MASGSNTTRDRYAALPALPAAGTEVPEHVLVTPVTHAASVGVHERIP